MAYQPPPPPPPPPPPEKPPPDEPPDEEDTEAEADAEKLLIAELKAAAENAACVPMNQSGWELVAA